MTDSKAQTRSATGSIEIEATPEEVWEMIATGEGLARWFPVEARVRPGEGGEIFFSWGKGVMEGTAKIVTWDPPRRLVSEWGGMQDQYTIEGHGGRTTLSVVSSGFGEGKDWDQLLDSTNTGWMFELGGLKHALEKHPGETRDVVRAARRCEPDLDALSLAIHDRGLAPGADLRSVKVGDAVTLELDGFGAIEGRVAVANPPRDLAIVTPSIRDAYWRVLIEAPCGGSAEPAIDATLWASTYGVEAGERGRLREAMARTLDRLLGGKGSKVEF